MLFANRQGVEQVFRPAPPIALTSFLVGRADIGYRKESMGVAVMMADPGHRVGQPVFVAPFRREVQEVVGADQDVEAAGVGGVGVEDFAGFILIENASARGLLARKLHYLVVVIDLVLVLGFLFLRKRNVVVEVEVVP